MRCVNILFCNVKKKKKKEKNEERRTSTFANFARIEVSAIVPLPRIEISAMILLPYCQRSVARVNVTYAILLRENKPPRRLEFSLYDSPFNRDISNESFDPKTMGRKRPISLSNYFDRLYHSQNNRFTIHRLITIFFNELLGPKTAGRKGPISLSNDPGKQIRRFRVDPKNFQSRFAIYTRCLSQRRKRS